MKNINHYGKRYLILFIILILTPNLNHSQEREKLSQKVNINKAYSRQLMILPGVGPHIAAEIIRYRERRGTFYYREQIMNVKGIGFHKYQRLKRFITVGNVIADKRFALIRNWTMKQFIDVGLSPTLSNRVVLFIKSRRFKQLSDLLKIKGVDETKLKQIREKLDDIKND